VYNSHPAARPAAHNNAIRIFIRLETTLIAIVQFVAKQSNIHDVKNADYHTGNKRVEGPLLCLCGSLTRLFVLPGVPQRIYFGGMNYTDNTKWQAA
jgi:hypothetical protein